MKGYLVNKKLYVFPQTVDTIPTVDADVIFVQREKLADWKKANAEVEDILVGYNYYTITVNAKEWAGHTNDDITPTPVPTGVEPTGVEPTGVEPTGAEPTGAEPTGAEPTGAEPTGADNPE